jgi:hypothetical protein
LEARPGTGDEHVHAYGHEGTDTSVRHVAVLAGAFVGLLIFGLIVGYGMFRFLTSPETVSPPPALTETGRTLPPSPRLQVNAPRDLADYMKLQQQTLDSYGWVDEKAGVVRVPIERAMDLLVEKGLPVRTESAEGSRVSQQKPANGEGKTPQPVGAAPGNSNQTAGK